MSDIYKDIELYKLPITVNCKLIDLLNLSTLSKLTVYDYLIQLSRIKRFNSARGSISVLEHTIAMLNYCKLTNAEATHELLAHIAIHDFHEAIISDIPSPVGKLIPGFNEVKNGFDAVIYSQFNVEPHQYKPEVRYLDNLSYGVEFGAIIDKDNPCLDVHTISRFRSCIIEATDNTVVTNINIIKGILNQ